MFGALSTLMAYLLGSVPFGYGVGRWKKGIDVRATGSGSIGATNVMRNLGIAGFFATFLLDAGKGLGAAICAKAMTHNDSSWVASAAVAAILGHCFPIWLKFRGGKGVATGLGAFISLSPVPLGLASLGFAVVVSLSHYVSLGSIIASASFPALLYIRDKPPLPVLLGAAAGAAIIIVRHNANIRRLLNGTENRLGKK